MFDKARIFGCSPTAFDVFALTLDTLGTIRPFTGDFVFIVRSENESEANVLIRSHDLCFRIYRPSFAESVMKIIKQWIRKTLFEEIAGYRNTRRFNGRWTNLGERAGERVVRGRFGAANTRVQQVFCVSSVCVSSINGAASVCRGEPSRDSQHADHSSDFCSARKCAEQARERKSTFAEVAQTRRGSRSEKLEDRKRSFSRHAELGHDRAAQYREVA